MNKSAFFIAALAMGTSLCVAEEPKSSYSVTLDFPYVSEYVFRGVKLAKDSIQPSVELTTGDFYGGVWTNQPVVKHFDNEFDFYAGYKTKLNETWNVDVGTTLYYYPELDRHLGQPNTTDEYFVGLNGNLLGFTPGVYGYYDVTLKAWTGQLQVGYSFPLRDVGASLDFTATGGRVSRAPAHGGSYNYGSFGVNVPYRLSDKATAFVGGTYATNDLTGAKRDNIIFTACITIGF